MGRAGRLSVGAREERAHGRPRRPRLPPPPPTKRLPSAAVTRRPRTRRAPGLRRGSIQGCYARCSAARPVVSLRVSGPPPPPPLLPPTADAPRPASFMSALPGGNGRFWREGRGKTTVTAARRATMRHGRAPPPPALPRRHAASTGASDALAGARGWGCGAATGTNAKTHSQGRDLILFYRRAPRVAGSRFEPRPRPRRAAAAHSRPAVGVGGDAWPRGGRPIRGTSGGVRKRRARRRGARAHAAADRGPSAPPVPPAAVALDPAADSPTRWGGWSEVGTGGKVVRCARRAC